MLIHTLGLIIAPQVKSNGLIVFVPKYGIEGPVYLTPPSSGKGARGSRDKKGNNKVGAASADGEDEAYILDEEAQAVTSK